MSDGRTGQVRELFIAARALERGDRTAFLERAGERDAGIVAEVRELLAADEAGDGFLRSPALGSAFRASKIESMAASHDERQLERIGPYRIEGLIAEGGFARVYAARQESPVRRRVAIKLLKPGVATKQTVRRFGAERQHLATMNHPTIAQIYDAGETEDGRPYFVMEYIEGSSITRFCEEHELGHRARVELVRRACEALQHAHAKGVIHRDLKPSNILAGNHSSEPRLKIIDFGIAKALHETASDQTMHTRTGQILGTLPYASPEQLMRPGQEVDVRCDIYALGAVLYELLSGRAPHDVRNASIAEAALRITRETPARLGSIDTALRGDLETITAKALSQDPDDRYQSMSEFAADLSRFLQGDAVLARPPSLSYQLRKLALRHKGAAGGVLMTALVAAAAFVWVVGAERSARRDYESARETIHFLLSRVMNDLDNSTGTFELRREVVDQVFPFIEQHRDESEIAEDYVRALWAYSDLALEEGRISDSLADRQKASGMLEKLVAESPEDLELQASRSIGLVKIGDCYRAMGENGQMELLYLQALLIDESLAVQDPGNLHFKNNLAWSHERIGWVDYRNGYLAGMEGHFERWSALAEELLAANPYDHTTIYGNYEFESILSRGYLDIGDTHRARTHIQRAWEHLSEALRQAPENRRYLQAMTGTLFHLARRPGDAVEREESLEMMDEGIARLEHIIRREPQHDELLYGLGRLHCIRAEAALSAGDVEGCIAHLEETSELIDRGASTPDGHIHWDYLHISYLNMKRELADAIGKTELAKDLDSQICECHSLLAVEAPNDPAALLSHASCLYNQSQDDVAGLEAALHYAVMADAANGGRNQDTLALIAMIEIELQRNTDALETIDRARELVNVKPSTRDALDALARRAENGT